MKNSSPDLVKIAQLAKEFGCSRQNLYACLRRWGVEVRNGLVSRKAAKAARARLGSPTASQNARSKRSEPPAKAASRSEAERQLIELKVEGKRLALAERRGTLIKAEDVQQAAFDRGRCERDALLNWPVRICGDLAAKLGVDERTLHSELDLAVRAFLEERGQVK